LSRPSGDTSITALVGDRIDPVTANRPDKLPFIVVTVGDGRHGSETLSGTGNDTVYTLDVEAPTYDHETAVIHIPVSERQP
jgi:hypothetical protein